MSVSILSSIHIARQEYGYTWRFHEVGVPANHPKSDRFCIETNGFDLQCPNCGKKKHPDVAFYHSCTVFMLCHDISYHLICVMMYNVHICNIFVYMCVYLSYICIRVYTQYLWARNKDLLCGLLPYVALYCPTHHTQCITLHITHHLHTHSKN